MDPHDLLFILLVSACTVQVSFQGPDERRLLENLLRDYNSLERPVFNESQVLDVEVGIFLRQIMDVDEKNQVLKTNIWLQMSWTDYKLQWNKSEYNGLDKLRLPAHLLWKPDILLYNSADERFDPTFHTKILVSSAGNCLFIPPGIFKSTCDIDLRWFPFDIQKCDLKFGSWTYGGWSLDLSMIEADLSEYVTNEEWDLVVVSGKKNNHIYDCCPEPYPDVTYTIVMRRRPLFYALSLLIPCFLISILAVLVFLLPADSREKISLGITVMLALIVFMLLVAEIMPATSDSVPLIAQYFVITLVIVAHSVIATVVVLQFHHHDPNGAKMPKWIRVVLFNWCAWFLRMKRPDEDKTQSSPTSMDLKARMESIHLTSSDSRTVGRAGEGEVLLTKVPSSTLGTTEPELANILDEVRYIAKRFHDQHQEESTRSDWKFAAAVIDRLCFVIFSILVILCTFGILMTAPNITEVVSKDVVS
ncbi:neuronal acetylcholine receptor subunit alpha-7-like isoform X1 [Phyllopteryx taeniolatus]|uniref:neuronal acetylcholine receptor subunit alpha-7-like isoform X1 n=1 Tax=Phyllopteryx taeniolatus TaxID=161469 RepID=UPI002AD298C5|nr:neuronal acetylcholine receptor subunit alpha-7-like isoform X1 [Phyllopteryx taeniolatus]